MPASRRPYAEYECSNGAAAWAYSNDATSSESPTPRRGDIEPTLSLIYTWTLGSSLRRRRARRHRSARCRAHIRADDVGVHAREDAEFINVCCGDAGDPLSAAVPR